MLNRLVKIQLLEDEITNTIESANFFKTFTLLLFTIKPEIEMKKIEKKIVKWQKSFPNILAAFLRTPGSKCTVKVLARGHEIIKTLFPFPVS